MWMRNFVKVAAFFMTAHQHVGTENGDRDDRSALGASKARLDLLILILILINI